jgi:SAM-dependent methyltransferase
MKGLNIGDTVKWRQENKLSLWRTVDHYKKGDIQIDLREIPKFPLGDSTLDVVFSSHILEHMNNECALHVLKESYRTLKPKGTIRIAVPSYEKAVAALRANNKQFFKTGGVKCQGDTIERLFANFVASFKCKDFGGQKNYTGGPILNKMQRKELRQMIDTVSIDKVLAWCVAMIPSRAHYVAHINGYNYTKMHSLLKLAGFANIKQSSYRKSAMPILRRQCFDNRQQVTLFVEAIKN